MAKYPDVTAGQVEACINRMGGWDKFLLFIGGKGKVVFGQIFTFIGTGLMMAQPTKRLTFEFVVNELRINGTHYDRFMKQFYDLESPEVGETEIVVNKLEEETPSRQVLEKLGDKAEINPLQFLMLIKENEGSFNDFTAFIRGKDGNLWVVTTTPGPYGSTYINADPVVDTFYVIEEGSYLVSRK
ncbi:MAG: hypothetical protein EXS47_02260 [Candidatus Zambryskibacteria bacterium]|nr:hypothetical protein [Candidatus Zambryskibacteria bacterium]